MVNHYQAHPPPGYYWERLIDKSWELKKYLGPEASPEMIVFEAPAAAVIEQHVIVPTDPCSVIV